MLPWKYSMIEYLLTKFFSLLQKIRGDWRLITFLTAFWNPISIEEKTKPRQKQQYIQEKNAVQREKNTEVTQIEWFDILSSALMSLQIFLQPYISIRFFTWTILLDLSWCFYSSCIENYYSDLHIHELSGHPSACLYQLISLKWIMSLTLDIFNTRW